MRIILEQGIADEIVYDSEDELTNVILNVLKTKKMIQAMQKLIDAVQKV